MAAHEEIEQQGAVCTYDFTSYDFCEEKDGFIKIREKLEKWTKKWCFQLEKGETGHLHWQGRFSLKVKQRIKRVYEDMGLEKTHYSITSKANRDNQFYVMKEDTRVNGPWSNEKDTSRYIPRDVRQIETLWPWQLFLLALSKVFEDRKINCILDFEGNTGKSTFTRYMMAHGHARMIPYCNDYKDIMRMVMDMPENGCYIFDLPRAINKERLNGMFAGIESIKGGYAYDDRYNFKDKMFDPPVMFIFTNHIPDSTLLSRDRWVFWSIKNKELVEQKVTKFGEEWVLEDVIVPREELKVLSPQHEEKKSPSPSRLQIIP